MPKPAELSSNSAILSSGGKRGQDSFCRNDPKNVSQTRAKRVLTPYFFRKTIAPACATPGLAVTTEAAVLRTAEDEGKPVYVLRKNTMAQIEQFIRGISRKQGQGSVSDEHMSQAMRDAEDAVARIDQGEGHVELDPQGAYVRRLQHEIADRYGFSSSSMGRDPRRRVVIYRR